MVIITLLTFWESARKKKKFLSPAQWRADYDGSSLTPPALGWVPTGEGISVCEGLISPSSGLSRQTDEDRFGGVNWKACFKFISAWLSRRYYPKTLLRIRLEISSSAKSLTSLCILHRCYQNCVGQSQQLPLPVRFHMDFHMQCFKSWGTLDNDPELCEVLHNLSNNKHQFSEEKWSPATLL